MSGHAADEGAPVLAARGLVKRFGERRVIDGLDLHLERRSMLAVLGRSGSGKTTLLRMLAGLESPDAGRIWRRGDEITCLPARQREVVYLGQEPLLFPHLSVFDNVAFGLRLRGLADAEVRSRTRQMLECLELGGLGTRRPWHVSGGERQRVAFGRALVVNPSVLLLDEPFGSLDAQTRTAMQTLFLRVARACDVTALFVTHDLKEALRVGDRLARLEAGRLRLFASRRAFIEDPATGVADELAFWDDVRSEGARCPARGTEDV